MQCLADINNYPVRKSGMITSDHNATECQQNMQKASKERDEYSAQRNYIDSENVKIA